MKFERGYSLIQEHQEKYEPWNKTSKRCVRTPWG